jgi:hypothetical protein
MLMTCYDRQGGVIDSISRSPSTPRHPQRTPLPYSVCLLTPLILSGRVAGVCHLWNTLCFLLQGRLELHGEHATGSHDVFTCPPVVRAGYTTCTCSVAAFSLLSAFSIAMTARVLSCFHTFTFDQERSLTAPTRWHPSIIWPSIMCIGQPMGVHDAHCPWAEYARVWNFPWQFEVCLCVFEVFFESC